ncbi:MAG: fumarylacetoacetate hydrolase family protein [Bacteroidota bacterium]|nr:fumarylacetoacetate hydrolase family protein [Bacteroidota bacterium]MDP4211848.1 fumarylacetoacetate hydrolase family protein [Bacteroidota bacterium]MDP4250944.1 fumarylacetoacetate hydrolase family protein [Bacteroidota bacterium]
MKLLSYLHNRKECLGFICQDKVFSLRSVNGKLPVTMDAFLRDWEHYLPMARDAERHIHTYPVLQATGFWLDQVQLLAPVPRPASCRDGYAFREHAVAFRKNSGLSMIPEFEAYPVFHFGNHQSIFGPGVISCMPDHFDKLDFELQAAIVICKKGRNIAARHADEYIGGLMIMNDFCARRLQSEEMVLNLGPAKGKDFATSLGPFLVTPEELKSFEVPCKENHVGRSWNLRMRCLLNGRQVSDGNLADMEWTFAEIIERASYGTDLYPGDIIGSGAVGTGCLMELNVNSGSDNFDFKERWLDPGDEITLCVEELGELKNILAKTDDPFSILMQKKNQMP